MIYTGPKLSQLLEQQHQQRPRQQELFKKGTFTLQWRAKVGSSPHPDLETMISAGEPCGAWRHKGICPVEFQRPESKRNVGENLEYFPELPLNGYIPGSSIRGLVRSWARQHPEIQERMQALLGYQDNHKNEIHSGKIEFLDAYPEKPTRLTLDIVNPQQEFQVYHQGQSKPLSFYTLGDGKKPISVTVAIRGIPNRTTAAEVEEVWQWVEQALYFYGVGSRTASGYGCFQKPSGLTINSPHNYSKKLLNFILYSQGSYGANQKPNKNNEDLRPVHWRGWLRSWVLRFLLGVMTKDNAERTLGELLGTIGADNNATAVKGHIRLRMIRSQTWGQQSANQPSFYLWKGQLELSGPRDILNNIILPIVRFAASVGGVGRGWRRPLHIFTMNNGHLAARGTHLVLTHRIESTNKPFTLNYTDSQTWQTTYQEWLKAVTAQWSNRIQIGANNLLAAEVFSPTTCAVYILAGPVENPLEQNENCWAFTDGANTRGDGVDLIYQEEYPRKYKRNPDLGGNAGGGGAYCSWVSIRRVRLRNEQEDTDCQETVCLFMGDQDTSINNNHVRALFLRDLDTMPGKKHLFGVQPQTPPQSSSPSLPQTPPKPSGPSLPQTPPQSSDPPLLQTPPKLSKPIFKPTKKNV